MAIEIVDFSHEKMVIFHSYVSLPEAKLDYTNLGELGFTGVLSRGRRGCKPDCYLQPPALYSYRKGVLTTKNTKYIAWEIPNICKAYPLMN